MRVNKISIIVIILGVISIIGLITIQYYWLQETKDLKEVEFQQKTHIALLKVAKTLADKNGTSLPDLDLIKQVSSNYYIVNVNTFINAIELENSLIEELNRTGVNIPFEYSIYDCDNNEMVYGGFCTASVDDKIESSKHEMVVSNDFLYYFGIRFPSKASYIWRSIDFSILLTILFVTMLFFATTIYFIIRQNQMSKLQSDFINNMTHEFKTPLTILKLSNKVFSEKEEIANDLRLKKYLKIVDAQHTKIENHIERLLEIATLDKFDFKLEKSSFDIIEAINENVTVFKERVVLLDGEINFTSKISSQKVRADLFHFKNLIDNILDNAIKYKSNVPLIIRVEVENKSSEIQLNIIDNGIGIKKEDLNKVFQKFYRSNSIDVHNHKGFGLGLFYVKRIIELHKWEFRIESKVNEGTKISIFIPK